MVCDRRCVVTKSLNSRAVLVDLQNDFDSFKTDGGDGEVGVKYYVIQTPPPKRIEYVKVPYDYDDQIPGVKTLGVGLPLCRGLIGLPEIFQFDL